MQSINESSHVMLSTRGLGKRYANGTWGLRDASLILESGKMIAVLGPNGAGKSTLIHMLSGAIRPSEGNIDIPDPAPRIGWSSQRTTIDWYLNVQQNVELGGLIYGLGKRESRARARGLLQQFHLDDLRSNDVSMLSGGQQQRIQVARTLMSEPEVMLLDEPTASLDIESSESVLAYVRDYTRQGALAIVSSHDLGLLERFCDEVIFVLNGRVVAHKPMNEFVQQFSPQDTLILRLDRPVTVDLLDALQSFNPVANEDTPTSLTVSVAGQATLSDVMRALGDLAIVLEASRSVGSLRNTYLQLTQSREVAS